MPFAKELRKGFQKVGLGTKKIEKEFRRVRDQITGNNNDSSSCPAPEATTTAEKEPAEVLTPEQVQETVQLQEKQQQELDDFIKFLNTKAYVEGDEEFEYEDSHIPIKGPLTLQNEEYYRAEAEIDKLLEAEIMVKYKPLDIPIPDFSSLKPFKGHMDDEESDDEFGPRKSDEANKKKCSYVIMENVAEEEEGTDDYYSTDSLHRGLALFLTKQETKVDRFSRQIQKLKYLLENILKFSVHDEFMQSREQVIDTLKEVSKFPEVDDGDCLIMFILTTGLREQNGREYIYCGKDKVETSDLWPYVGSIESLANKPKIIVQIVWSKEDSKYEMKMDFVRSVSTKEALMTEMSIIPKMSHFFIVSMIASGETNEVNCIRLFINTFTSVLKEHFSDNGWDINSLMTEVNYRMGQHESRAQAVSFTSSLTRYLRFKTKKT